MKTFHWFKGIKEIREDRILILSVADSKLTFYPVIGIISCMNVCIPLSSPFSYRIEDYFKDYFKL